MHSIDPFRGKRKEENKYEASFLNVAIYSGWINEVVSSGGIVKGSVIVALLLTVIVKLF